MLTQLVHGVLVLFTFDDLFSDFFRLEITLYVEVIFKFVFILSEFSGELTIDFLKSWLNARLTKTSVGYHIVIDLPLLIEGERQLSALFTFLHLFFPPHHLVLQSLLTRLRVLSKQCFDIDIANFKFLRPLRQILLFKPWLPVLEVSFLEHVIIEFEFRLRSKRVVLVVDLDALAF